jgi:hypothetical protein
MRFLEFFAANIRNPHTRRAYARAGHRENGAPSGRNALRAQCTARRERVEHRRPPPAWEKPSTLAKYYVCTEGVAVSQT